jgi:hypothetical protein
MALVVHSVGDVARDQHSLVQPVLPDAHHRTPVPESPQDVTRTTDGIRE